MFISVSKVSFLCQSYQPCERANQKTRGDGESKAEGLCDPAQTSEQDEWERACTRENNTTEEPDNRWFICQTNKEMTGLHSNILSSGTEQFEKTSCLYLSKLVALLHPRQCLSVWSRLKYLSSWYIHVFLYKSWLCVRRLLKLCFQKLIFDHFGPSHWLATYWSIQSTDKMKSFGFFIIKIRVFCAFFV